MRSLNRTTDVYAPRFVHEYAARVLDITGETPVVERVGTSRWRLTVSNDRVRGTLDFKMSSGGRCVWAASTLFVDGERQEVAEDLDHFARLYRDPDRELHNRQPDPIPLSEPIAVREVSDAPRKVRASYRLLTARADGATVQVGTGGPRYWTVQLETGAAVLRLNYLLDEDGLCGSKPRIQLVVDGEDLSQQIEGSLDRALALMQRPDGVPGQTPLPIGGTADAARTNSVEVRQSTVMRN